ncbi:MAG: hypothetical protein WD266_07195 [Balneolales bacterium]
MLHRYMSKAYRKISFLLNKHTNFDETAFVSLKAEGSEKGTALISYVAEPFFLRDGESIPNSHTHYLESLEMAQTFRRCGYSVDIISYRNTLFKPRKKYTFFIGARTNFERVARLLNDECIKIAHMDMSHWLFNNSAAINRCLQLQQRRGVTLRSYKLQEENWAVEHADFITVLGNKFTEDTYAYAGKPIYHLPIPSCITFSEPADKDFGSCKRRFLWFGSRGMVHKGLDLVLEAFLDLPDHHLTVCGPVTRDKDLKLAKVFQKELYETPNIHTEGWVNVESPEFAEITGSCIGMIFPSAAEGGGGCVITTMHAGLIPIVSYEASVDVDSRFGVVLRENTVEEIKREVLRISALPDEELKTMSRKSWQVARQRYTREQYSSAFENIILELVKKTSANSRQRLGV